MIDPKTSDDLDQIQSNSGLNRSEFAQALGYSYVSFKEFYSGRYPITQKLRKSLIMFQLLSKRNVKMIVNMS